jgi:hypothetical protein
VVIIRTMIRGIEDGRWRDRRGLVLMKLGVQNEAEMCLGGVLC